MIGLRSLSNIEELSEEGWISTRLLNCLRNAEIDRIEQLRGLYEAEVLRFPGLGRHCFSELTNLLQKLGEPPLLTITRSKKTKPFTAWHSKYYGTVTISAAVS